MAYPKDPSEIAESLDSTPVDLYERARDGRHRLPEAESAILGAGDTRLKYLYARNVIYGRWPQAEHDIARDPMIAYLYAVEVLKERFPEAEPQIIRSDYAVGYARNVIKARWKEAEPFIMRDSQSAYEYATEVIKDRWPEYEKHMAHKSSDNSNPMDDHEDTVDDMWLRLYKRKFGL